MKIFITGGYGFVGRNLCRKLYTQGHELIVLRRDCSHPLFDLPITTVNGDISDLNFIERVLAEYEIETVFHLAAQTQVSTAISNPLSTFEINIAGTWNIFEACRKQKTKRIIFASSDKCFGHAQPPYHEELTFDTDRPYETSKACADMIAKTYQSTYGMSIATTRFVNLYGPGHLNFSTLMAGTIKKILNNEAPIIKTSMERDWLFIDDAVEGYVALMNSTECGPFCFGTGKSTSVKEVVLKILKLMNSNLQPIEIIDNLGEIQKQWSGYEKAKEKLNWEPKYTLEQGLEKTIDWYRNYLSTNK